MYSSAAVNASPRPRPPRASAPRSRRAPRDRARAAPARARSPETHAPHRRTRATRNLQDRLPAPFADRVTRRRHVALPFRDAQTRIGDPTRACARRRVAAAPHQRGDASRHRREPDHRRRLRRREVRRHLPDARRPPQRRPHQRRQLRPRLGQLHGRRAARLATRREVRTLALLLEASLAEEPRRTACSIARLAAQIRAERARPHARERGASRPRSAGDPSETPARRPHRGTGCAGRA